MKRKILNILAICTLLTTIGYIMDGDVKEPSMLLRFLEFIRMISILFILISPLYFAMAFFQKKIKGLKLSSSKKKLNCLSFKLYLMLFFTPVIRSFKNAPEYEFSGYFLKKLLKVDTNRRQNVS